MQEPSPMSEIMPKSLKLMGEEFYTKYLRNSVIHHWRDIVGEANAEKFKPLYIQYRKLFVYCTDSSWKSVVYAYKSEFIKKINDYVNEELIEDIIFNNTSKTISKAANKPPVTIKTLPYEDRAKEIRNITLSKFEMEDIKNSCECIENDELREAVYKASISGMKLDKYRRAHGWHNCPKCGMICPPEYKICDNCRQSELEAFEKAVLRLLKEVPGLTFAEIKSEIEKSMPHMLKDCTPEAINDLKSKRVQQLCHSIDLKNNNQVSELVMLFKGVKAENLSEKIINKALFELRYDLPLKGRF